jgi:hypothetical protein
MAKFTCHLTRMVEEVSEIVIEAPDAESARAQAYEKRWDPELKWTDGDDMGSCRVWLVADEAGNTEWEG